jgi:threonine dehydrogenase-like Zn-dependent dehydrogenase
VECYEGKSDEGKYDIAPYTPGHEWCGEVVAVGSKVLTFKPGDKVVGEAAWGCGVCENCKNGMQPASCKNFLDAGFDPRCPAGWGEYMLNIERHIFKIPDDWKYTDGMWVETFSVAYGGLWGDNYWVDASDTVLVYGGGPIGICATMVAAASNAKIIVVEPFEKRRELAKKYGADYTIDPTQPDWKEQILKVTDNDGPSVIAECSGNDNAVASVFDVAGMGCRISFIGHTKGRKIPVELGMSQWKNLKTKGAAGSKDFFIRTIRFMSRIRNKFDFDALVTHMYPFEQLNAAMDTACKEKATAFKVAVSFDIK